MATDSLYMETGIDLPGHTFVHEGRQVLVKRARDHQMLLELCGRQIAVKVEISRVQRVSVRREMSSWRKKLLKTGKRPLGLLRRCDAPLVIRSK